MKPKVLHIIIGKDFGGRAIRTRMLSQHLMAAGFNVVVCGNYLEEFNNEFNSNGICFIGIKRLEGQLSFFWDIVVLWRLINFIRTEKFEIIHTHTVKAGLLGRLAAWLAGTPVIIHHFAGFGHEKYKSKIIAGFYLLTERVFDKFSDISICVSEAVKKTALKHKISKNEKLILVYNGIDLKEFSNKKNIREQKVLFNIPYNSKVVCYIGRLAKDKGIEYFLESGKDIIENFQDITYLLVGDGALRYKLEEMVTKLGISKSVIFAGHRQNIPEILSVIDILVLPSLREGFSGVILEAMAASKPCIGTNVGGTAEAINNDVTGFVVPPKDSNALTNAIRTLLRKPALAKEMGLQGRLRVEKFFTAEKMSDSTTKIYHDLLIRKKTDVQNKYGKR